MKRAKINTPSIINNYIEENESASGKKTSILCGSNVLQSHKFLENGSVFFL